MLLFRNPKLATSDADQVEVADEVADIFAQAVGKTNYGLPNRIPASKVMTKEQSDTMKKIYKRDAVEHADLPIPVKVMRTLMGQGMVPDPFLAKDHDSKTKKDRKAEE
ncbi:unnamed protein product [Polarella glacialis]|uniref:Uncharacterized protein n=1 Tax=Polarella glacialis TaxID=89957 RepID=A0A813LDT1_POLGL|nr:unnamed protein product [Polarella glacialis]CAE8728066.1 unnamed protein product [Polarella glacialis]